MTFGMWNAPVTFQPLMQKVLSGVMNYEAYLAIYSNSWEDHVNHLDLVLTRPSLTLNLLKFEFAKAVITYIGKLVGQGHFPTPVNKRELCRFLGMAGYYSRFCLSSDWHSQNSKKLEWNARCDHAFTALKDLLCNAPALSAPDFTQPFQLNVVTCLR